MKKYLVIIIILSAIKFTIHSTGNQNYGFHRDELLHLSVSEHMDCGYMEFPPFIAAVGKVSYWLFDYSLWGMRLFSTLAGIAILVLCCLMAREFGGRSKAVLVSGISILAFLPFYRNHTLFQPVAFDQLFWTLGFYLFIRFINTKNTKFLLLLGLTAGLGLMNKYTIVIWGFGILIGLIFYQKGQLLKNKWLYLAGLLALAIISPNIIWQFRNDFPFLLHLQVLKTKQLDEINPFDFGLQQLELPFTLAVSIVGVVALFMDMELKKYKSLSIAVIVTFATMWILQSKAYYIFGIYPVLFASGSVKIERLLQKSPKLNYVVAGVLLMPSIPFIPELTPVLPIDTYVNYTDKKEIDGRIKLTSDYADMFGWDEQVKLVDSIYHSLSKKDKQNCVLWAENYGEAGALKILGDRYGLPDPICRHGSFWLWGYGNEDANVWISLGNEASSVNHVFEEVKLVKKITHKYAIDEENNIPVYLCRKPKVDIEKWWSDYRDHVFD